MVIFVVDEMSQEQWVTVLLSFSENVAMEIVIQAAGLGTIFALPANAMQHLLLPLVMMYVLQPLVRLSQNS